MTEPVRSFLNIIIWLHVLFAGINCEDFAIDPSFLLNEVGRIINDHHVVCDVLSYQLDQILLPLCNLVVSRDQLYMKDLVESSLQLVAFVDTDYHHAHKFQSDSKMGAFVLKHSQYLEHLISNILGHYLRALCSRISELEDTNNHLNRLSNDSKIVNAAMEQQIASLKNSNFNAAETYSREVGSKSYLFDLID